jgi:glutathione S-transferase
MGNSCNGNPGMSNAGATRDVKVYGMSISGNVIPAVLFCRDKKCGDFVLKDMMKGELKSDEMLKINPWGQMPSMTDGDFKLAESNAILRYLANVYDISAYGGMNAVDRARIDWAFDWQATNFASNFKDIWYPVAGFGEAPKDQAEANDKATKNLELFASTFLTGGNKFVGGAILSIADYKIGTLLWYMNHDAIKKKANFTNPQRIQQYVSDWHSALSQESKAFLSDGKGFLDTKL